MRSFFLLLILSWASTALAQSSYENVLIFNQPPKLYPPCEPSIAIDPNDPSKMVAGAVLDYVFTSSDSGKTWTPDRLKSRYGVYGDPCVIADENGHFYYFHLSNPSGEGWKNEDILDRIVCQYSKDGGESWSRGSSIGNNGLKDQDKEWAVYDPIRKMLWVTWTQFDDYGNESDTCESNILLSYSKDGKSWSEPAQLTSFPGDCKDHSETAEGAVPAAGLEAGLRAWSLNGQIIAKPISFDDEPKEFDEIVVDSGAHWAFKIPGIKRANGMPITKCDLSNGPHRGTIYINWADQRQRQGRHGHLAGEIHGRRKSWSEPIRVE